jgi:hypothetical protein
MSIFLREDYGYSFDKFYRYVYDYERNSFITISNYSLLHHVLGPSFDKANMHPILYEVGQCKCIKVKYAAQQKASEI